VSEPASLIDRILGGANPQLQRMAADGLVPLPPEELIPVQVVLASAGADPAVRELARRRLGTMEPKILARFLETAAHDDLAYFAAHAEHPLVLETLLRRRDVPRPLLAHLAPRLHEDLQEVLLLRQDAIVDLPAILDALESNPRLSSYAGRRIREYREHLLPRAPAEAAVPVAAPLEIDDEEWTDEQVAEAIEEVKKVPAAGEQDEETGLSDAQIRMLPLPARLKLARKAGRSLRNVLVRDPNPKVAVSVIKFNHVPDSEVELIANNRSVCEEVLAEIGSRREWMRKRLIVLSLVQNPKAPAALALKLVPRLSLRELRGLSLNRNISDAVRSTARRLYTIKSR
jgi:hypothetical protein